MKRWIVGCVAVAMLAGMGLAQETEGLTEKGKQLETQYAQEMATLKAALKKAVPEKAKGAAREKLLASDKLDAKLVKYVVLKEGTPGGLAEFAQKSDAHAKLIRDLLANPDLMRQMLVADGAKGGEYGRAMNLYSDIQNSSNKASSGSMQRLSLAIALEHAVPRVQRSAKARTDAPKYVNPLKRYLSYEKAYLEGELDPAFDTLDAWSLRFVVDGEEPDAIAAWGREMLRNFRPDHIFKDNFGWRYVAVVPSEVRYGSGDVKHDRPDQQFFQNILMNGGVCGRRAFFGRFILRAFGIPTTARPSSGHGALCHWTPKGWVVNLGPRWGSGWTKTVYRKDKDFLASTQARVNREAYLQVKRAMWIGDVMGEKRVHGEHDKATPAFWNSVSLKTQRKIIGDLEAETLDALGAELGESNKTVAQKVMDAEVNPEDKKIAYGADGSVLIPVAAYAKSSRDVLAMKSFAGGMQVFLPRFARKGITVMRGGAWRGGADGCRSGWRMPSSGYGRYNNWGFRAAMTPRPGQTASELTLDLGDGVKMAMVYIKPGTFIMGGENSKHRKWHGRETPKHEVTLTKGYYMGKYEVTQEQFKKIMGRNPSKANKDPKAPADTISEGDAVAFCGKATLKTGQDLRLPTEAEWEYACRAGTQTKFFFGDDASKLADYAWYEENDGGKSHPVGQKKPNPWGLYDIQGNVCERVSDVYAKDYYAKSPKIDPTGPKQPDKSRFAYEITVPKAGKYELTAKVVTANAGQELVVTANGGETVMEMPFTLGKWQESEPVTVSLKQGSNKLKFLRRNPPQYGMAVKSFDLTPAASRKAVD